MAYLRNNGVLYADCDAVVIPVSTEGWDSARLVDESVQKYGKKFLELVKDEKGKAGEVKVKDVRDFEVKGVSGYKNINYVFYVYVSDLVECSYTLLWKIGRELGKLSKEMGVGRLACPVWRGWDGDLDIVDSRNVLVRAFEEEADSVVELCMCVGNYPVYLRLKQSSFPKEVSSRMLVFRLILSGLWQKSRHDGQVTDWWRMKIQELRDSNRFYYEEARSKFVEFLKFRKGDIDFYVEAEELYRRSGDRYDLFLEGLEGAMRDFFVLCGGLAEQLNRIGRLKNEISKSFRSQRDFLLVEQKTILNLIAFKRGGNDLGTILCF